MNEQLIKFIELCLTDGVISDKEREVIFKKSDELGISREECEVIIDSMIQKNEKSSIPVTHHSFKQKKIPKLEILKLDKKKELLINNKNIDKEVENIKELIEDNSKKIKKVKNDFGEFIREKEKFINEKKKTIINDNSKTLKTFEKTINEIFQKELESKPIEQLKIQKLLNSEKVENDLRSFYKKSNWDNVNLTNKIQLKLKKNLSSGSLLTVWYFIFECFYQIEDNFITDTFSFFFHQILGMGIIIFIYDGISFLLSGSRIDSKYYLFKTIIYLGTIGLFIINLDDNEINKFYENHVGDIVNYLIFFTYTYLVSFNIINVLKIGNHDSTIMDFTLDDINKIFQLNFNKKTFNWNLFTRNSKELNTINEIITQYEKRKI